MTPLWSTTPFPLHGITVVDAWYPCAHLLEAVCSQKERGPLWGTLPPPLVVDPALGGAAHGNGSLPPKTQYFLCVMSRI
jgi:hypothetical protein